MTDIKKISSKIILHHIRLGYYLWSEMDEAEAELLSRLEQGQKALEIINRMRNKIADRRYSDSDLGINIRAEIAEVDK